MSNTQAFKHANVEIDFAAVSDGAQFVLPASEREAFEAQYEKYLKDVVAHTDVEALKAKVQRLSEGGYADLKATKPGEIFSNIEDAFPALRELPGCAALMMVECDVDDGKKALKSVSSFLESREYSELSLVGNGAFSIVLRVHNPKTLDTKVLKMTLAKDSFLAYGADVPENLSPDLSLDVPDMPEMWYACFFEEAFIVHDISNDIGRGGHFSVIFEGGDGFSETYAIPGDYELFVQMVINSISEGHYMGDHVEGNIGYHPEKGFVWVDMGVVCNIDDGPHMNGGFDQDRYDKRAETFGPLGKVTVPNFVDAPAVNGPKSGAA